MVSGIITAILILAFCGIVNWAWSSRRREAFDAAARMALEEDSELKSGSQMRQPK